MSKMEKHGGRLAMREGLNHWNHWDQGERRNTLFSVISFLSVISDSVIALRAFDGMMDPNAFQVYRGIRIMKTEKHVDERYHLSGLTSKIIAAAKEVHNTIGPGFEEKIYQRALALELPAQGLEYSREVWIDVIYKGEEVGKKRVDFIVDDPSGAVMVEIKAKSKLEDVDFVQALSYLKASGYQVGLLINFGGKSLQVKRLANWTTK